MQIGIIGLPNSGKTTLFNALTRGKAETEAYASAQMEVHTAIVAVHDQRVDRLSAMFQPRRTIYATVQYNDIAGLTSSAEEKGMSGPLLNQISANDALLHVVRCFTNPSVPHPAGKVDPARDLAALESELWFNDYRILEGRQERLQSQVHKGGSPQEREQAAKELAVVEKLIAGIENESPARTLTLSYEEEKHIRSFSLLTMKPELIVFNIDDEGEDPSAALTPNYPDTTGVALRGKLEMELAQMEPEEAALFMDEFDIPELGLDRVIHLSYELLGLQSFFTVGEDEVRAWTVKKGATAVEAAAAIHTDLGRGFIRAEVIHYNDLIAAGSMAQARKAGLLRLEGRDYPVQDGDIVHIRFNV